MARLDVRLLGVPVVTWDGVPIAVDTRKAVALLARLVVEPGPHARDVLATWLWPEADQHHARAALRRTLSALLGATGDGWLDAARETLAVRAAAPVFCDCHAFRALQAAARAPELTDAQAIDLLEQAAALYRSDFMAGFALRDSAGFDDWQFDEAEALRRDLAWVLERVITLLAARGEYARAIPAARRWLALDPLHEPAHRWLMQCSVGAGEHAAALAQYRECVRLLDSELGVAPLAETTALYEAIREQRSAVAVAAPVLSAAEPASAGRVRQLPLIGRAAAWSELQRRYAAQGSQGLLLVIEGEAGVGKSRLVADFAETVRAGGGPLLQTRCYEGETDLAYGPLIDLLRAGLNLPALAIWKEHAGPSAVAEVARLVPELDGHAAEQWDVVGAGEGARVRFFSACAGLLQALLGEGERPGLVVFDDLHWADDATLKFLGWLLHRPARRPYVLLVTWRAEDVQARHLLRGLLAAGTPDGDAERIVLERLTRDDVTELVQFATGDVRLAGRLYEETEGLPFFLDAYLAELAEQPDELHDVLDVPSGVRDILLARLARVGEIERQLLSAGAAIGRSFEIDTLRVASGRGEDEAVLGLEHLLAAGLLSETTGPDGAAIYDFSHERLRALVYGETSLARRRLLHRRIAEGLAARLPSGGGQAALIANHYRLAGLDGPAAEQFRLAGMHARGVYATQDAIAHFQAALALGYPNPVELHQSIGDLRALLGAYAEAQSEYEAAMAHCPPEAHGTIAELEQRIGELCQRRGDWSLSESHFRAAEAGLPRAEPEQLARLLADWSLSAHRLGDGERAAELAERAIALARQAEDDPALARTWNILGVLARSRGDRAEALRCLEESRGIAERIGDRAGRAAALNNLALVHATAEEWQQAIDLANAALADCIATGDRHREAALLNNLADFFHALGQDEVAMTLITRSVAIYADIGTFGGEHHPEIWKLVDW